jgi:hypothetical protein
MLMTNKTVDDKFEIFLTDFKHYRHHHLGAASNFFKLPDGIRD